MFFFPKEKKLIILIKKLHTKVCIVPTSRRVTSFLMYFLLLCISTKESMLSQKTVCKISPMGSFLPEKTECTVFPSFVHITEHTLRQKLSTKISPIGNFMPGKSYRKEFSNLLFEPKLSEFIIEIQKAFYCGRSRNGL